MKHESKDFLVFLVFFFLLVFTFLLAFTNDLKKLSKHQLFVHNPVNVFKYLSLFWGRQKEGTTPDEEKPYLSVSSSARSV